MNTCYNALDYHVENGDADKIAIVYDSPVTNTVKEITYGELLDQVSRFAGVLAEKGIIKGDRVIINHPDIAECAVIGVEDELKGQLPLGLVVLKSGVNNDTKNSLTN